jgi:hypothetical protein
MTINIIDPHQPGRQRTDSYWAVTAGDEVENTSLVTAGMDVQHCFDQSRDAVRLVHDLMTRENIDAEPTNPLLKQPLPGFPLPAVCHVYQRAMYQVYEIQDRLP